MSDGKDWVTIKVPEEDRDKAKDYRPEGATHGDCLVAGAERLSEHLDSDTARFADGVDAGTLAGEIADAVELEANGDGVDPEVLAREVAARVDYGELANRTADELEGRMR